MVQTLLAVVLFAVGLGVAGLCLRIGYVGWTHNDAVTGLEDVRTTAIGDLEPGRAAVAGTVEPARDTEPVTGPLSGDEGVVAHATVSVNRGSILDRRTAWTPFDLVDDTGRVRVVFPPELRSDATRYHGDSLENDVLWGLDFDRFERTPVFGTGGDRFADYDAVFDTRYDLGDVPAELRTYRERVVEPGEEVFVMGEVRRSSAGWDRPEWTITADDHEGFVLSDDLASESGRARAREDRTVGRFFGSLIAVFGLGGGGVFASAGLLWSNEPLVTAAVGTAALAAVAGVVALGRREIGPAWLTLDLATLKGLLVTLAIGLPIAGLGGMALRHHYETTGSLLGVSAWPAYLGLGVGLLCCWSAVGLLAHVLFGVDLPLRARVRS